jgi:arylsulfatase A-like enzyme
VLQDHRELFIAGSVLLFATLVGLPGCGAEESGAPSAYDPSRATPIRNVILITLDTVRADALGSYGQELPTSPVLDMMAAEGARFERVITSAPSTLPSHATILTGKQPYAHGARANAGYALAADNVSLAEVLLEQGFRTGAEVAAAVIGRQARLDQGFESFRDTYSEDVERTRVEVRLPGGTQQVELPERRAKEITDRGLEFLRAHRTEPMFL